MKVLLVDQSDEIPDDFTGVVLYKGVISTAGYFQNGKRHRTDGPAITGTHQEFWLRGNYYKSEEEWFYDLTPDEKEQALWNRWKR